RVERVAIEAEEQAAGPFAGRGLGTLAPVDVVERESPGGIALAVADAGIDTLGRTAHLGEEILLPVRVHHAELDGYAAFAGRKQRQGLRSADDLVRLPAESPAAFRVGQGHAGRVV